MFKRQICAGIFAGQGHMQVVPDHVQPHVGRVSSADEVAARIGRLIPHHEKTIVRQRDILASAARGCAAVARAGVHLHHELIAMPSYVKHRWRAIRDRLWRTGEVPPAEECASTLHSLGGCRGSWSRNGRGSGDRSFHERLFAGFDGCGVACRLLRRRRRDGGRTATGTLSLSRRLRRRLLRRVDSILFPYLELSMDRNDAPHAGHHYGSGEHEPGSEPEPGFGRSGRCRIGGSTLNRRLAGSVLTVTHVRNRPLRKSALGAYILPKRTAE